MLLADSSRSLVLAPRAAGPHPTPHLAPVSQHPTAWRPGAFRSPCAAPACRCSSYRTRPQQRIGQAPPVRPAHLHAIPTAFIAACTTQVRPAREHLRRQTELGVAHSGGQLSGTARPRHGVKTIAVGKEARQVNHAPPSLTSTRRRENTICTGKTTSSCARSFRSFGSSPRPTSLPPIQLPQHATRNSLGYRRITGLRSLTPRRTSDSYAAPRLLGRHACKSP